MAENELKKFWNWYGSTPEDYANNPGNGEYETEYPDFEKLYEAATDIIKKLNSNYDSERAELLIQLLAIDNECENILDMIKTDLADIQTFCRQVSKSKFEHARWQMAELLAYRKPSISSKLLIDFIEKDVDLYVKRRALLSLKKVDLASAKLQSEKFIDSEDPIFKRIALEIKNETKHNIT